jgi:dihydroorotase
MRYLIRNGTLIDPMQRTATVGDLLVSNGLIEQVIGPSDAQLIADATVEVIDAHGCFIAPGFVDLHVHLREPGEEQKETIASGSMAAAAGGFTTICALPTSRPSHDSAAVIEHVRAIARRESRVQVELIGALTRGREGSALADMIELAEAGCVAFSDGGRTLADAGLMRHALAYAAALDLPVLVHCEEPRLSAGWAMHEGAVSTRLGLPGFPSAAEEAIIARDIALAEATGARLHICQVSSTGGVALIRAAKMRGVRVTADVTPHHLVLNEAWVLGSLGAPSHAGHPAWLDPTLLPPYAPATRVAPPLRTTEDNAALLAGLRDGTIDAIASGHTPQARVDKECEYALAAPGINALETALGLLMGLVKHGDLDLVSMITRLTEGPTRILGRTLGALQPGATADLVIIDPEQVWRVDATRFISRGYGSPLHGQQLSGRVMLTMAAGRIAYQHAGFAPAHQP